MAKAQKMNRKRTQVEEITEHIDRLMTTKAMIVKELENGDVVAQDDQGMYITKPWYVDTGLMDPFRSANRNRVAYEEPEAEAAAEPEAAEVAAE